MGKAKSKASTNAFNEGGWTPVRRARWLMRDYTHELTFGEKMILHQLECDEVSRAGVTRLAADVLAGKHPDVSAEEVERYLRGLEQKGWIARSGTEVFVRRWFHENDVPSNFSTGNNLAPIRSAVQRITHDDLRATVVEALFHRIVGINRLDGTTVPADVKELCKDLAATYGLPSPPELRATREAAP